MRRAFALGLLACVSALAVDSPPPRATIALSKGSEGVIVRLSSDPKTTLRWQIDGGPWQDAKDNSVVLPALPDGRHTLKAMALDAQSQAGGASVMTFEIKPDPRKQTASLIKQLNDPDFAKRESAVAALARQPALALPALKAAREKSDEDLRWWIDAAIQEAERAASH